MPTINPRVQVTLSPSLDALVRRMAVHQRVSKSQVLRELLEAAEPALQRAVVLMDAATKATAEVRAGLARSLERAQDVAEDSLAVHFSRMERMTDDLVSKAEAVRGRRPARRGAAPRPGASPGGESPPASNRGVKSVPTGETRGPAKARRRPSGGAR
jgi:hypothetical protein